MAYTVGAETNEIPVPDHECTHTSYMHIHIDLVCLPQATTLASYIAITVTSTMESLIIEPQ